MYIFVSSYCLPCSLIYIYKYTSTYIHIKSHIRTHTSIQTHTYNLSCLIIHTLHLHDMPSFPHNVCYTNMYILSYTHTIQLIYTHFNTHTHINPYISTHIQLIIPDKQYTSSTPHAFISS